MTFLSYEDMDEPGRIEPQPFQHRSTVSIDIDASNAVIFIREQFLAADVIISKTLNSCGRHNEIHPEHHTNRSRAIDLNDRKLRRPK
jgi:hypothetical protein